MEYIIGEDVYNLIPKCKIEIFKNYINTNNIELEKSSNNKLLAFAPKNLDNQISIGPLYRKDRWFENIVKHNLISKYFYKRIDNVDFENKIKLEKFDIFKTDRLKVPYQKCEYLDYIPIHNFKYNITLFGKVVNITDSNIELLFYNVYDVTHQHTIKREVKPTVKQLGDTVLRNMVGTKTEIKRYEVEYQEDYEFVRDQIDKNLLGGKLDFYLIYPKLGQRRILSLNGYRIFDRILDIKK